MGDKTGIEWTATVHPDGSKTPGATWNPLRGCTRVSAGCENCYAETVAARFSGPGQPYEGLAKMVNGHPRWTNKIMLVPHMLEQPARWRRPRMIFVNSMSDLFHKDVPDTFLHEVFHVMALCPHHTFQVLTKRPERMAAYCQRYRSGQNVLPNVWLGTSCENQATADERIPWLLKTPAAAHFLSCEPLLGPIDLERSIPCGYYCHPEMDFHPDHGPNGRLGSIGWCIVGAESGHGARPMDVAWARQIKEQCVSSGVAFFFKQMADERGRKIHRPVLDGQMWEQWPEVRT